MKRGEDMCRPLLKLSQKQTLQIRVTEEMSKIRKDFREKVIIGVICCFHLYVY